MFALLALVLFVSTLAIYPYTRDARTRTAVAATNSTINFQARILTNTGAVVPDGSYNVQFKIYDGGTSGGPAGQGAANAGTLLWTETWQNSASNGIVTKNGYITATLGSITAFSGINWDQELWVTMNIGGTTAGAPTYNGEMLMTGNKRIRITAVPYAFSAAKALNVSSNDTNAASTNTNNVVVQSGNANGATSNSGNVTIDAGTATQTKGSVYVGNTNAAAVYLGKSGTNVVFQSNTIQNTTTGFTIDVNNAANSTLTVTNSNGTGVASLSVEGGATFGGAVSATTATLTAANALTLGTASSIDGAVVYRQQASANTLTLAAPSAALTGNFTVRFPAVTANATICTDNAVCSGYQAAGSYATTTLNNLGVTSINASLLASANNSWDIGASGTGFKTGYFATSLVSPLYTAANNTNISLSGAGTATIAINTAASTAASTGNITIQSGNATVGANLSAGTVTIDTGTKTGTGTATVNIGNTNATNVTLGNAATAVLNIGNVAPTAARTTTIAGGNSGVVDTVNIGTGNPTVAGGKTVNIGTGTPTGSGSNLVTIGSTALASATTLQAGTGNLLLTTNSASASIIARSQTGSATAFAIQDSGSAPLLTANTVTRAAGTAGNTIKIGDSTGTDTATTVLILDAATAVPTTNLASLNGGLFYNSTTNKISIVENGTVKVLCNTTDLGCGTGGTFLAKNATDTSSAAAGAGYLYGFTNSSAASTGGVVQLDNGTNTGNALRVTTAGNPAAGSAVIFASNTNAAPTGNLLDLQSGAAPTSKFSVSASGAVTSAGAINGLTLTSAADGFTIAGGTTSRTLTVTGANITVGSTITPTAAGALAVTANGANTLSLDGGTTGAVNIAGSSTGDVNLAGGSGTTGCTVTNSTGALTCTAGITSNTNTINTNTFSSTALTFAGAGATTIQSASGQNLTLQTAGAGNLAVSATGTGTVAINTAASAAASTGNITIQSGNATVGANLSAGTVTIDTGTKTGTGTATVNIGNTNATNINLGTAGVANTIQIGQSGATAVTQAINIGTGAAGSTTNVTVGNANAGTLILQGATRISALTTNGFVKTSGGNGALSVSSAVSLTTEVSGILPAANGGTANGFTAFTGPTTATKTFTLPDVSTTICTTNSVCTGYAPSATNGYVQLAPGTIQSDANANASIFINKTAGSNFMQFQASAVDKFVVTTAGAVTAGGDYTFQQGANRTISVANATGTTGFNLSVIAGAGNTTGAGGVLNLRGGAGGATGAGGDVTITAGAGGATSGNGGNITLVAGTKTSGTAGGVTVKPGAAGNDSAALFQVQTAAGVNAINLNTTYDASNLLSTNPSFEVNTTGWAPEAAGGSIARTTTAGQFYYGNAGGAVTTTTTAGTGVRYNLTLTDATTYNITIPIKGGTAFSTLEVGYASTGLVGSEGTAGQNCTAQSVTTSWGFVSCTITTTTHSGTPYIYIKQTDAGTARTFYIDGAKVVTAATGNLGFVESHLSLQDTTLAINTTSDTQAALTIQQRIGQGGILIKGSGEANLFQQPLLDVQNSIGSSVLRVLDGLNTARVVGGNSLYHSAGLTTVSGGDAIQSLNVYGNSATQTGDLLRVQKNAGATSGLVVTAGGKVGINTAVVNTNDISTVSYDLTLGQGADRTIGVETQATAATAGNNLTITAGTGNTTGAGGNLILSGGAKATGSSGSVIIKPQASNDSATALMVQNAAGTASLLTVDTSANQTVLGKTGAGGIDGKLVFNNASNAFTVTLQPSNSIGGSYSLTLPASAGSPNQCLQNSGTAGVLTFAACAANLNLQTSYNTSAGATPSIAVNTGFKAVVVQNSVTTGIAAGNEYFGVRAAGASDIVYGNSIFTVNSAGVGINIGGTGNPVTSYDLSFGQGANRTIGVQVQGTAATAGNNLTISAGQGNTTGAGGVLNLRGGSSGTGATGNGGALALAGGAAASTNGNGGDITLTAGAKTGTGTGGSVIIKPGTSGDKAGIFQIQNAAGAAFISATTDSTNLTNSLVVSANTANYTTPVLTVDLNANASASTTPGFRVYNGVTPTNGEFAVNVQGGVMRSWLGVKGSCLGGYLSVTRFCVETTWNSAMTDQVNLNNSQTITSMGTGTHTIINNYIQTNVAQAGTSGDIFNVSGTAIALNDTTGNTAGVTKTFTGVSVNSTGVTNTNSTTTVNGITVNNPTGVTGDLLLLQGAGTESFSVSNTGAVLSKNTTDSATAFQIQNAAGANLIKVDNASTNSNLITNPSAEVNTTGWNTNAPRTGTAISRTTTAANVYYGVGAIDANVTTGATTSGVNYPITLTAGVTYNATVMMKLTTNGNVTFGYAHNGTEGTYQNNACYGGNAGTGWYICSFTFTPATVSGSPYFFIKQNDTVVRHIYIDGLRVWASGGNSLYQEGAINIGNAATPVNIGGSLSNPITSMIGVVNIQQVRDKVGLQIRGTPESDLFRQPILNVETSGQFSLLNVNEAQAVTQIQGGSAFWGSAALRVLSNDAGATALRVMAAPSQTGNIFEVTNNGGTDLFVVGSAGNTGIKTASAPTHTLEVNTPYSTTGDPAEVFITSSAAGTVPLVVQMAASPTVNAFQVRSSTGAVVSGHTGTGRGFYGATGPVNGLAVLSLSTGVNTNEGIVVQGSASQSADYFRIQTNAAANVFKIDSAGNVTSTGNILGPNVGLGAVSAGYYGDTTNLAIRAVNNAGGLYIQTNAGGATQGYWNFANGYFGIAGNSTAPDAPLHVQTGGNNWTTATWKKSIRLDGGANAIEFSGGTANPTGIGGTTNGVYIWEAAGETGASGLTYVMRASSSLGFSAYIANGAGATAVCASATAVGNRTFTAAATTCTNPSSIRLKENVASMSDALDILGQLRPVSFNWKASTGITAINGGSADYGFIAEEVDNVLPELVSRDENGQIQGLSYTGFIPFLARAIQQQQAEIQALQGNAAGITGGGTVNGNLAITGSINVTGPTTLGDLTVNGNAVFNGNLTVQDIQVANITINGHVITAGNTPTITTGTAAGVADPQNNIAAPVATVDGNDTAGTITIVAGANTTAGNLVELTFNTPFTKSPKVMLNAGNADTANLKFYRDAQTGKFTIKLSQAPDANKTYQFDYWVAQ